MKTKKQITFFLLLLFVSASCFAKQDSTKVKYNPYKINYFVDIPITVTGLLGSKYGTDYLRGREPKSSINISNLNPKDIGWLDRGATKQNYSEAENYLSISDYFLRFGFFGPFLMYIDPKVRDLGLNFALLHAESQAINSSIYLAASVPIPRLRPFMYNPNVSAEIKHGRNTTNSFFSGHVSTAATATFFMVKVYYDLHPKAKNKFLFYGLATIPPAYTGYLRYKGSKHFPTDILTGFAVGVLTGILIPELHKRNSPVKIYPIAINKGLGLYAKIALQ